MGLVSAREPFSRLLAQGMVHGETHRSAVSGRFLKPGEVKRRVRKGTAAPTGTSSNAGAAAAEVVVETETGQPVVTTWEKMSKVRVCVCVCQDSSDVERRRSWQCSSPHFSAHHLCVLCHH